MGDTKNRAFVQFVKNLQKDKPNDLIQIFDRKTFYTVYGDDALFVAREYNKTDATITYLGSGTKEQQLAAQSINRGQLETVLRDLLHQKMCKVEVWASKPNTSTWIRIKKGSPGNVSEVENYLLNGSVSDEFAGTMAVRVSATAGLEVGVACVDMIHRTIYIAQFPDRHNFVTFESAVIQASGVKECLVCDEGSIGTQRALHDVLERCGVAITDIRKSHFSISDVEQDLTRLLGTLTGNLPELELKVALSAVAAVVKYLDLLGDDNNSGAWKLERLELSQYVRLDAAAVDALRLLPNRRDVSRSINLYSLLDKCSTRMGSRQLMNRIRQPLRDVKKIEERLDLLEAFNDAFFRAALRDDLLKKVPDLDRLVSRMQKGKATLEDAIKIYTFVRRLPGLHQLLSECTGKYERTIQEKFTSQVERLAEEFAKFVEMIELAVDLEAAEQHEYLIRPNFDDQLEELFRAKEAVSREIASHSQSVERQLGLKSFQVNQFPQFGWCFRVSRKDEKELRKCKLKYTAVDTKKDGVKFRTVQLKSLGEQYNTLHDDYKEAQQALAAEVMKVVVGYVPALSELSAIVTEMDLNATLSHVFANSAQQYVRPRLNAMGTGSIVIKGLRHPCMEVNGEVFIPNDVNLIENESMFHIITGPNMGGKSTYIRSIGVAVHLAQMGCFVPATEATISCVDAILCRVGAGDSQSRGVSTFMAEMLETTCILNTATANSLVIVDELGRGTSTYDGFGLAWAISKYGTQCNSRKILHICEKIGCFCLFATHFHELTQLANEVPTVRNLHVSARAENNELTLLYKVKEGACDQSFGIHVAQMANFPDEVLKVAKRKASELENFEDAPGMDRKRRKTEEQEEADAVLQQFLLKFRQIPLQELSPTEAMRRVRELRDEVLAPCSNAVVRHLLESS